MPVSAVIFQPLLLGFSHDLMSSEISLGYTDSHLTHLTQSVNLQLKSPPRAAAGLQLQVSAPVGSAFAQVASGSQLFVALGGHLQFGYK